MIKNLVLDLGNVLVEFRPNEYMKRLGFETEKAEKLEKLIFKDARWNEFDRGSFRIEEYAQALKKENPSYAKDIESVFQKDWIPSMFLEKNETISFLKEASKKYQIYVLSNVSKAVLDYIKTLDFWNYITSGTYSYLIKACKPEEKIYTTFLEENHVKAEECYFMDDRLENIQAAEKIGMKGIVFTDEVLFKLREML